MRTARARARAFLSSAVTLRFLVIGSVGLLTFLALQVVRVLAEANGLCTGCNVGGWDGSDALVAATVAGGAAAWSDNDELIGEDWLDGLLDGVFGASEPDRGLEGMGHAAPHDSSRDAPADVEWIRENLSRTEPSDAPGVAGGSGPDNQLPPREPGPQSRYSAGPRPPDKP